MKEIKLVYLSKGGQHQYLSFASTEERQIAQRLWWCAKHRYPATLLAPPDRILGGTQKESWWKFWKWVSWIDWEILRTLDQEHLWEEI